MQSDYRIFVGAFPNGVLGERIQTLRQCYDAKTAAITAPHVTLAGTYWRNGPPTQSNESVSIERLQAAMGIIPAFELSLGGICIFPGHRSPVIYLGVEISPGLLAARRALLGVLGMDKHRRYTPHLTLAMRLKAVPVRAMLDDLLHSEWDEQRFSVLITKLNFMQRGPDDPCWRSIAVLNLSQTYDA